MPRKLLTPEEKLERKRESNRRWAEANPDKMRRSRRKYDEANKRKIAEYKATARTAHPEKFRARTARWRDANPEKCKAYSAKRYRESKEAFIAQIAKWREANMDRVKQSDLDWKRSPEGRAWRRRYANKRHAENIQARLATLIRNRVRKALKGENKSQSAVDSLGCSLDEAIAYLASQFVCGMSWDNHGKWHIDHIRPLASFDLTDPAQFAQACHYTNLQPLWGSHNQSKGSAWDENKVSGAEQCRLGGASL